MTTFEIDERGHFWWADESIPEGHFAPENAVTGLIQVDANGATKLTLDNVLSRSPGRPTLDFGASPAGEQELAAVGLIKRGKEHVRLEQLSNIGLSFGVAQHTSEYLRARLCVRGHRLITDLPPNRYCTGIRLSLAGFEEWLQFHNLKLEASNAEFAVRIPQLPEKKFELENATISVGVEVNSRSENPKTALLLRQEGYLIYTPKSPMTLDEVRDTVRKLEDLLVLLTDCERTLGFPQVRINGADDWSQVSYETLQRREKEIDRSDLWTTFQNLSPDFGKIATAWFAKSVEFGPGFHLYLGNRRGMQLYVEHRFANLGWGLEAFHRSKGEGTSNTALAKKIERILNAVDKTDHRWLAGVLKHSGEPNLAQRILEVLALLPLGFDAAELEKFANHCAVQRNLISHYGGRLDGESYEKHLSTWILLSQALDPLYHARILQEIGFPEAEIHRIFWDISPANRIRDALVRSGLNIHKSKEKAD